MKTAQEHADDLKDEAKSRINSIFREAKLPYTFEDVDRIVDCIVGASILTAAALQAEAIQKI